MTQKYTLMHGILRSVLVILTLSLSHIARGDEVIINRHTTLAAKIELSSPNFANSASNTSSESSTPSIQNAPLSVDAKKNRATTLFNTHRSAVLGANPKARLIFKKHRAEKNALGEYFDFEQQVNNVPVAGGAFRVHFKNDTMRLADGATIDIDSGFSTDYVRNSSQVAQIVSRWAKNNFGIDPAIESVTAQIFNKGFYLHRKPDDHTYRAWKVELLDFALDHEVWVDDASGAILYEFSRIAHGRNRLTYDFRGSDDMYYLERTETSPPSSIAEVNQAHNFMGDAYNYYFTMFGRDSYDDAGSDLISLVRYCVDSVCPFGNAFWYSGFLVFGHGFTASDDIVSHELTHGVIEHSANLIYQYQSGALNEAFADIFGESVDLLNASGTDTSAHRWDIGEDLDSVGAFRDMQDPHRFSHPAQYGDIYYYNGAQDNGGVHINSGVPNRSYTLVVDGGSFGGYSIDGIGLDKAARIYYRTLTTYLTTNSQFSDAFYSISRSCDDLIGSDSITASDCEQVCKSLLAVKLNTAGGQCYGIDPIIQRKASMIPIIQLLLLD